MNSHKKYKQKDTKERKGKKEEKLLSGNKRKQLCRGFHFALYNPYTLNSYTLKKTLLLRDWIRE